MLNYELNDDEIEKVVTSIVGYHGELPGDLTDQAWTITQWAQRVRGSYKIFEVSLDGTIQVAAPNGEIKFVFPNGMKFGPDDKVLAPAAAKIEAAFSAVPGTLGIKHDWDNQALKLVVDINQVRARRAGITSTDVAKALSTSFSGTAISEYQIGRAHV